MIKFKVTVTCDEAPTTDHTYTAVMLEGESKADMMARVMDDHRYINYLDRMTLEAVARIER